MFEKQALKQYDRTLDQESWPLLELTDACVYRYRRNEKDIMADLLDVQDTGPYRIRGKLSPVPAEFADIVYPGKAARLYSEELIIAGVTTYSIQSLSDGTFTLWALGQCGWYSLRPSRRYAAIFAGATEKMELWAFLQDRYLDAYSGAGPPIPGTVAEVYSDYSRLRKERCPSAKSAQRLFDQHHRFLLFEMCAAWTDTPMWARTPLFRDWEVAYKREVEGVVKMAAAGSLEERIKAGAVKREVKEEEDEEEDDDDEGEVLSSPPPRSVVNKQGGSWKTAAKKVPAKKLMPAKKLVQQKLAPIFIKKEPAPEPEHIIILDSDNEPDIGMHNAGADSDSECNSSKDGDEDEEDTQPSSSSVARRGPGRPPKSTPRGRPTHSSKGKSILRPVHTPAPPPAVESYCDSDSDSPLHSPRRKRVYSDPLYSSPEPPKRAFSSTTASTKRTLDTTTAASRSASKRTCTSSARSAASTPSTSTSTSTSTSQPSQITTLRIGGAPITTTSSSTSKSKSKSKSKSATSTATATAKAIATATAARIKTTTTTTTTTFISPLSSIAPKALGSNRPGGLWECEIAGCRHFILDADREESLAAVEAHYEEHGRVMRIAMEAIGGEVVEERGGGGSVDNLLAKIEAMAERWAMAKPAPLGGDGAGGF